MSKLAALVVFTVAFSDSLVAAQSTIRVSLDSSGNQANVPSIDAVTSSDGRFTAFRSVFAFVVTDTNAQDDIYRRDRVTGQTVLVSISTSGAAGAGLSFLPSITPIGRFVVFVSNAPDLVTGDTNGQYDVFVRDMVLGTTELVSKSTAGVLGNFDSGAGEISNDGRYVAFISGASNLVTGDTNADYDVFLRDRTLGTTIRVSVDSAGNQANGASGTQKRYLQISGNGRYVTFASSATNLVVANDTNGVSDVFVRNLQTGYTVIASVSSFGANGDGSSDMTSISLDGRYVAFQSSSTNLSPLAPSTANVYVRDRATGLTTLESPNQSGNITNSGCVIPSISNSGRYVVFQSSATDLVTGDTNGQVDVFLRDRGALPEYFSYCFGDGFGASCPCANESQYGLQEGCKHALGYGGKLTAEGIADTTNDTFVLVGSQLTNSAALYFQGTTDLSGGNGIPFGDGLLCVGGTITRLGIKFASLGTSRYPEMSDPTISVAGAVPFGTFRYYQAWFRDSIPFCTIATYNLTNAIGVLWLPCPMCP